MRAAAPDAALLVKSARIAPCADATGIEHGSDAAERRDAGKLDLSDDRQEILPAN